MQQAKQNVTAPRGTDKRTLTIREAAVQAGLDVKKLTHNEALRRLRAAAVEARAFAQDDCRDLVGLARAAAQQAEYIAGNIAPADPAAEEAEAVHQHAVALVEACERLHDALEPKPGKRLPGRKNRRAARGGA